jgi:GDPmannose 4,6-dehydratase
VRKALITTAYGQDSIYLGRLLREKGYEVLVLNHRKTLPHDFNHYDKSVNTDITNTESVLSVIEEFCPEEIYNLAAVSSVASSWQNPSLALEVNGNAVARLVSAIAKQSNGQTYKFFQAGSTDMVGKSLISSKDNEFYPWSPYGHSKEIARQAVLSAREDQGLWCVNGILTNHDSRYRAKTFVIPIIAKQMIEIQKGERKAIQLENPLIGRDWAHAKDIMEGAWKMMQQVDPRDLVLATGVSYTLTELIEQCSSTLKMEFNIEQTQSGSTRKSDFTSIKVDAGFAQEILQWRPEYFGASTLLSLLQDKDENCLG